MLRVNASFGAAHWDRRLSSRPVFGAAQCRAKDAGNRENPSNPSQIHPELDMREGICQVAPAARSPDAGIEPASGEAGWKAGAPRESRRSQEKLGPPAFQPARLWRGSMPRQRRRKSRKPFKPKLNPSELDMREGICQVAPAARSPDAGIEPASGEAGWKAGAPRKSRRSQGKPALPEKTGTAGFPAGPGFGGGAGRPQNHGKAEAPPKPTKKKNSRARGGGGSNTRRLERLCRWDVTK
jgi:hypothetical protein